MPRTKVENPILDMLKELSTQIRADASEKAALTRENAKLQTRVDRLEARLQAIQEKASAVKATRRARTVKDEEVEAPVKRRRGRKPAAKVVEERPAKKRAPRQAKVREGFSLI